MAVIPITPEIAIDEREIRFEFIRASGPGGQKVNKSSSAVQLRFDVLRSPNLPEEVRSRLVPLVGEIDGLVGGSATSVDRDMIAQLRLASSECSHAVVSLSAAASQARQGTASR